MKSNPTKTILTISIGLLIVYLILFSRTGNRVDWLLSVSGGIGLIGLFSDYLSQKIEWLWMKLAWVLSLIVPNILLSILFFFILFPIAMLSRIFSNKNALQLKNPGSTTWIEEKKVFDPKSMENPW